MPYIGGHTRQEDVSPEGNESFLEICKSTLKREIKEEIGISVSLDEKLPNLFYTPNSEKSKKHLAICFSVTVDKDTKLTLDANELVQKKGSSKSGRFLSADELQNEDLEDWGKLILKEYFKKAQFSLFSDEK